MKTHLDPLSDRAADWVAQVGPQSSATVSGDLALRGHALCEELRRRGDSADVHLIDAIEARLSPLPAAAGTTTVAHFVESATTRWNDLMNSLDREEENLQHVRRETRDVFFYVLDALILAEEAGGPDVERAAQELFNAVVADLYAFEPMADVAAELQPRGRGDYRLSDLLCTGVAGLFESQVRPRVRQQEDRVEVSEPVEEFVPLTVWLQRGDVPDARQPLTLATLAKRLAEVPAWYVKWSAQQLRVAVNAAARELTVQVIEGAAPSRALDGWQLRTGTTAKPVTIKAAVATISLPDKVDPSKFLLQIREPASGAEWTDVFARVGA
jgi:hypothetical protein